jgi:catechol 2,3-dioxygenase-like lactoylglutathione lyase family enzyme
MPHLFRVIVPVSDIERAAHFYGALLGAVGQRVSPGRHYFECEGTILACYDPQADGDGRVAKPLPEPIYIAVDDLESTYARAEAAGASLSAAVVPDVGPLGRIAQRPWGERSFYAADPFGNPLCFVARDSVFTGRTADRANNGPRTSASSRAVSLTPGDQ